MSRREEFWLADWIVLIVVEGEGEGEGRADIGVITVPACPRPPRWVGATNIYVE
jgi:hypothetical protein